MKLAITIAARELSRLGKVFRHELTTWRIVILSPYNLGNLSVYTLDFVGSKQERDDMIAFRHVLSDGRVLIIQRLKSRSNWHCCYIVPNDPTEAPEYLVDVHENKNKAACEDLAADVIRDDVLEVM